MTTQSTSQSQVNSLTKMQAGLNESSEPMATTRDVSWQTQGSSLDYLTLGRNVSVADLATQDVNQASKENMPNTSYVEYEILLSGASGTSLERNIILVNATGIELSCKLDRDSLLKNPQVTWKRGNVTLSHIRKTENTWTIQMNITDSSKMGSYCCILKGEKEEMSAVFHLQVVKIEGKAKPIISYKGDTVVMSCKSVDYTPMSWTWYMINGSEQIAINDSLKADKYVISRLSPNVTHLRIHKVTKEDDGLYWCEAAFELGTSRGRQELRVLSYLVPLKPFLAIVAEVVIVVTLVFFYEIHSKKKSSEEIEELDQTEQLKSEESNGLESSSARQRRI